VNGNLILEENLDLNGQTITLGASANLVESSGYLYGTSGTMQTTRGIANPDGEDIGGLGAIITDTDKDLGNTTIIRGHAAQGSNGIKRYYQITPSNAPTNATLVFNYFDSELNGVTESTLKLFKSSDGNSWTEQSSSTVSTENKTLTLTGINSFSWWTGAEEGSGPALPVNLSSFYATYIGGTPTLYWTTQSEENNDYWNVYRGNNNNFTEATHLNANNPVQGNGTTNNASDYIYVDNAPVVQNTTYWYWIEDVSTDGETEVHEPITLTVPFEDTPGTYEKYGLQQNYPNPFNPSTSISFTLADDSDVELIIYNIKGEKVRSIYNSFVYAEQVETVVWDGNDANGKQVSSGVYYYKLITDTKEYNKKMLMVK
ncbi:MAG: FlgD immunoglobulin-like domain containing protein, partial [Candidatus Cloacimonadota bacterium]|nr:FlgD immunoglobulin-like domain containing protein [Candidatus Cloacimonadota bacterium]